jgi:hypothetical protein
LNTVSQFQLEYDRLLEAVKQAKPGVDALKSLRKLRLDFDSVIPGYRNSLTILGDTTYEDRKHFLLELIQNADDAIYESGTAMIFFTIHDDSLEISYNEAGFTTSDVLGITDTGASTKKANTLGANSFIGEKGIGFKSVFALAKEVRIESGPWQFKLLKENYIVPELINPSTPHFTKGTKLRVYFSDPGSVTIVASELLKLVTKQLESFLFLQKLKKFHFQDCRKSLPTTHQLSILPNKEKDTLNLQTSPGDVERTYTLYEEEIEFPGHLVGGRWERLGSQNSLKRKMAVAAIGQSTTMQDSSGRLFCYLPTEVKLPIPVFLQLDGHLKADRERLHDITNNNWNKYLLDRVPSFLLHAILEWREKEEIAARLPDFVPDHAGEGQLSNVFGTLIDKCGYAPWVKTFDGWISPGQTIMAESFWYKWFEEHPAFRLQVEKVVGKKFMDPDWASNSSWKIKWKKYSISYLTPVHVAEIFRLVPLPDGFLNQNKNIVSLYKQLIRFHDNLRFNDRRVFVSNLFSAKIFPLEEGNFGSLKLANESTSKMYWMTGQTRRTSGLEGIIDVKIINPEYTYSPRMSADNSEERKVELKEISFRNELIKQVLRFMEVPEFNDDRLLTELQIPFLLKHEPSWTTMLLNTRNKVLYSIFEVYQAKRSYDETYLSQLEKLAEAYVRGTNGKVKRIHRTILPEKVRLFDEDHLYANAGLDSIKLPDDWFEPELQGENQDQKLDVYFKQLRSFLSHCGVANGPKFSYKERKYSSGREFRETEEPLFRSWVKKINNDYTSGNAVTLKSVTLDAATLQLLKKGTLSKDIAKGLYKEWLNKFSRSLADLESHYYRFDPPPGFIQIIYKRFENKKPLIVDPLWAGLDRTQIPLVTVDGRLTNLEKAFKVRSSRGFDKVLKYFDIVLENEGNGYHPYYLSSLDVKPLTIKDLNQKWRDCDPESYEELMKATHELSNLDFDLSELHIFDQVSEGFRSIRNFKLGKSVTANTPYIEEQYGTYGKLVGVKLGLLVDSEVTPLLHILDKFYSSSQMTDWVQTNITRLLQQWNDLRVDDKGKLINHITVLREANHIAHDTLIIFNDKTLCSKLLQADRVAIHLTCEPIAMIPLKVAAKELGFVSIDDIGTITAADPTPLEKSDRDVLGKMFEKYNEDLEPDESARLFTVLSKLGGKTDFHSCVLRAKELTKMIYDIPIPVKFPYYDSAKNHYLVSMEDTLYEISARLLSSFSFSTFRSANREFKEIYEKMIRAMDRKPSKEEKVSGPNNFKDVPVEFDLAESTYNAEPTMQVETSAMNIHVQVPNEADNAPVVQKQESIIDSKTEDGRESKAIEAVKKPETQKSETVINSKMEDQRVPSSQSYPISLGEVLQQISEQMVQEATSKNPEASENWKIAIDPEEGEKIRTAIGENLKTALREGPEVKEVKERTKKAKVKILDTTAQDPREFLEHEYNGRCQICSTQLQLANGKAYFEVFRIREGKSEAWWNNRPFNILSLCPNCHALGKHGGAIDFSSILKEAELVTQQRTFTQEVEAFHGDYFVVDIVHNSQSKQMVLSSLHIEYFTALMEHVFEKELVGNR